MLLRQVTSHTLAVFVSMALFVVMAHNYSVQAIIPTPFTVPLP
jgi:hypothetical protein